MWYAAANFDERAFPDPLAFDVTRPKGPANVAFGGGGAHFCIGATLARMELAIVIEEVLARSVSFELKDDPVFVSSNFINGIDHLELEVHGRRRSRTRDLGAHQRTASATS